MVHEDVFGAKHAIAGLADAHGIVVVFKKTDLETLVEGADTFINVAPHRHAKHGRHTDVERLASMRGCVRQKNPGTPRRSDTELRFAPRCPRGLLPGQLNRP